MPVDPVQTAALFVVCNAPIKPCLFASQSAFSHSRYVFVYSANEHGILIVVGDHLRPIGLRTSQADETLFLDFGTTFSLSFFLHLDAVPTVLSEGAGFICISVHTDPRRLCLHWLQ